MPVTQTFTYLPDGFVFEFVRCEDGSTACRLMPDVLSPASEPDEVEPQSALALEDAAAAAPLVAAPISEVVAAAPPYTKKQRTFMGAVRATWVVVFSVTGEGITYVANNLGGLSLPPGTGIAVGAVVYGAKRAIWPDTKF